MGMVCFIPSPPTFHTHFEGAKEKCHLLHTMPIITGGVPHNPSDCYVNPYLLESFSIINNCTSASAVLAWSCCRDNFWRLLAAFLAGVCGLFIAEILISFEIQPSVPWGICWVIAAYHCHNSLQADSGRQPCFLFTYLHIFLSNILGPKGTKKNIFLLQRHGGKGNALGPVSLWTITGGRYFSRREYRLCRKLQCDSILLHTNFNVVYLSFTYL